MIISFVQGYIGYFNESKEVDLKKYIPIKNKEQWNGVVDFVQFYTGQMILSSASIDSAKKRYKRFFIKDWLNEIKRRDDKNIGSLFIKSLKMPNCLTTQFLKNNSMNCHGVKDYLDELHQIFTLPGQNLSLPDIAYMYSSMDYYVLDNPDDTLVNLKNSFSKCIQKASHEFDLLNEWDPFKMKKAFQKFNRNVKFQYCLVQI